MKEVKEFRQYLSVELVSDVEGFFDKSRILKHYEQERSKCQSYYESMIKELSQMYRRNYLVIEILQDNEVKEYCEKLLKKQLLNMALDKIATREVAEMDLALMLVISEESIYKAIDRLQEILEDEIDEFMRRIVQDTIFRVGLKFLK